MRGFVLSSVFTSSVCTAWPRTIGQGQRQPLSYARLHLRGDFCVATSPWVAPIRSKAPPGGLHLATANRTTRELTVSFHRGPYEAAGVANTPVAGTWSLGG